ncbi:hypothetical protein DRO66_07135, partial [Candidatus Bathyarchaeota archaeon]
MIADYLDYFPFLSEAPMIYKRQIRMDTELYWGPSGIDIPDSVSEYLARSHRPAQVIELYPYGIFIPDFSDRDSIYRISKWASEGHRFIPVSVKRLDYREVVDNTEFSEGKAYFVIDGEGSMHATEPEAEDLIGRMRIGQTAVDMKMTEVWHWSREWDTIPGAVKPIEAADLTTPADQMEAFDLSKFKKSEVGTKTQSFIISQLKNYLSKKSTGKRERVPLLVGDAGTSKSALVASVAKDYGYRLVDFRAQFLEKVDLEGIRSFKRGEDGQMFSEASPHSKIFSVTDVYMEAAKSKMRELDRIMKNDATEINGEKHILTREEKEALLKARDKLKEESRPAVIFFDEILRAPPSIANALTDILNSKVFLGYKVTQSRIVCASNMPIEHPEDMDENFYLAGDLYDKAFLDRFVKLKAYAKDMEENWWDYIADPDKGNFHPAVVNYVKNDSKRSYNLSDVAKANVEEGESVSKLMSFPCFRTWEMVSKYINKIEMGETLHSRTLLTSLLGENTGGDFESFLGDNYAHMLNSAAHISAEVDGLMSHRVDLALKTNTPLMLLGQAAIGKTTMVKKWAKDNGAHIFTINLSQKSRTDILGYPVKVGVFDKMSSLFPEGSPLKEILKDTSELGIPDNISEFTPTADIIEAVKRSEIQPIIIYFVEFNRASDEVMSAIFEAVSNNRFGSLSWNPEKVKIVCDGNFGEDFSVSGLDPAFVSRFSLFYKDSINKDDLPGIREFVENMEWHPVVQKFIKDADDGTLVDMLNQQGEVSQVNN